MLQTVSIAGFLPFIEWTVTGNDMSGLGTKEEVNALVERSGSLNKGQNAIKIQEKKQHIKETLMLAIFIVNYKMFNYFPSVINFMFGCPNLLRSQ